MLKQCLLGFKVLFVALWTGLTPQKHLQVRLQVSLETLKASKAQVTLIAWVVPIASHGGSRVPSHSVTFRRGDLYIRGGGAQVSYLCLPFVVSQRDVLMVLLYVLGELEE